ncbi:hypothetical protein [Lacinutrix jangbogonensis]|uniref:hypothetical protein n=1 Tax=Lacinutrix jangbogonensis TaxID=1469557 RepID=UPI000B1F4E30|nr:hypothetical protein [Lacinutrix jangbogonensis]
MIKPLFLVMHIALAQDQEATLFFREGTSLKGYENVKYNCIILGIAQKINNENYSKRKQKK